MTEHILTDEQIKKEWSITPCIDTPSGGLHLGRAIEQAVLQSPEIQALRKDAERYRWATSLEGSAKMLHSIVLSYGGDQAKTNERVDFYRPAAREDKP